MGADDEELGDLDSNPSWGDGYRTCSECGADCLPEPSVMDELGARFVFVCPEHGVHSVVDPFEGLR